MDQSEASKALMWRITEEIWNQNHPELIDELIAEDCSTGTHTGEFMGIPPTGRSFDVPTFGILRFEEGHAVERWGFADNMAMMQQLGLTGSPRSSAHD